MVTDGRYTCDEHSIIYQLIQSLYYTPETNAMLCINYIQIFFLKFQDKNIGETFGNLPLHRVLMIHAKASKLDFCEIKKFCSINTLLIEQIDHSETGRRFTSHIPDKRLEFRISIFKAESI